MNYSRGLLTLGACLISSIFLTGCPDGTVKPDPAAPSMAGASVPDPGLQEPPASARGTAPKLSEFNISSSDKPSQLLLRREDSIKFIVWQHPELTQIAAVQKDGTVYLPMVGMLQADGKSLAELQREAQERLASEDTDRTLRFKKGDSVKLLVWKHPELAHVAAVQPDGNITLPLIGEVKAEGRTVGDIHKEVTKRYAAYVRDPQVSVLPEHLYQDAVLNPRVFILPEKLRPRTVAVLGEVVIPGIEPIHGSLRLMDALAQARYKDTGDLDKVIVIRNSDGKAPQYRVLNISDYIAGRDPRQNIYLHADDIVIIPKTRIAKVGLFIQNFFTNTKPVFDWWLAMQQARYAADIGKATKRLYDLLYQKTP